GEVPEGALSRGAAPERARQRGLDRVPHPRGAVVVEVVVAVGAYLGGGGGLEPVRQGAGLRLAEGQPLAPHGAIGAAGGGEQLPLVLHAHPEERAPAHEVPGERPGRGEVGGAVVVAARNGAAVHADGGVAEVAEEVVALAHGDDVDRGRARSLP